MYYHNRKGIILAVTLVFVMVMTIIAGISLVLMTQQARITEYQIKRIRAFYTAEAALNFMLQQFRQPGFIMPSGLFIWTDTTAPVAIPVINNLLANVTIEAAPGTGPKRTRRLTVSVGY